MEINEILKEENEILKAEMAGEERQKMLVEDSKPKFKCSICNNTGKPCANCGEYHSSRSICPPHEVRMKWTKNVCPDCGTKEPESTDKNQ